MTARAKTTSLTLLLLASSIGGAWAAARAETASKEPQAAHAEDVAALRREREQALGQIRARLAADSAQRASDREILLRVDRRVRAMYCYQKPPGCE